MSNSDLRLEPAHSIIKAFGEGDLTQGIATVAEITGRDRSRVLRWMYPKAKGGTDGALPQPQAKVLYAEACKRDLALSLADFFGIPEVA